MTVLLGILIKAFVAGYDTPEMKNVTSILDENQGGGFDPLREVLVFLGIPSLRTAGHEAGHFDQFNGQFGKGAYKQLQAIKESTNVCLDLHNILFNENPRYMGQEPPKDLRKNYLRVQFGDDRPCYIRVNYTNGLFDMLKLNKIDLPDEHQKFQNAAIVLKQERDGNRPEEPQRADTPLFQLYFSQILCGIRKTLYLIRDATGLSKWEPSANVAGGGKWESADLPQESNTIHDFVKQQLYQYCKSVQDQVSGVQGPEKNAFVTQMLQFNQAPQQ